MFFETMMGYLNDYFISPLFTWLNTEYGYNAYFGIVDGQVYLNQGNDIVIVNNSTFNLLSLEYIVSFLVATIITGLMIFMLVKFIIWLFKQITFITRF